MTRDEAVAMIKIQLGFRTDQTDNIVTALKLAQTNLEQEAVKPWFLLSERVTISTSADEPRIQLPTDFLLEHEENGLTYIPSDTSEDPVILTKDSMDQLKSIYKAEEGEPEAYALDGMYFRIFPIPDDAYTLEMYYYGSDDVLSTNITNGWLTYAPMLLMGEAGLIIAGGLRDAAANGIFSRWRAEGRTQLYRQNEARKHTNTSPQIGGEA